jgi:hypothetical protein
MKNTLSDFHGKLTGTLRQRLNGPVVQKSTGQSQRCNMEAATVVLREEAAHLQQMTDEMSQIAVELTEVGE